MKYKIKYVDKNYVQSEAIHLDLGNILHKVLEIKYRQIINSEKVDYEYLHKVILEGISEETEKDKGSFLQGLNQIKKKYGDNAFAETNVKSNLSYNDKMTNFYKYLEEDKLEKDWKPFRVEQDFEFSYNENTVLTGFIDRIDINSEGELRVVDYKSSNKVFDHKDLTTPLQMLIYALACENLFNKTPVEYQYDMILLGEKQSACTKGYYNRGIKKLDKILNEIKECEANSIYSPKPTPLCHWCDYSMTNPDIPFYLENICEYYCLWTPDNKTFQKNKEFISNVEF